MSESTVQKVKKESEILPKSPFKLKNKASRPSQKLKENNAKAMAKDNTWAKTNGDGMRLDEDIINTVYFPQNYKMFMLLTQLII